ncbi:hypothetical protein C8F04DRAFT_1269964 [Mycena alexandri]|uniref:Uncharacterized protein n=1 Tax=Mycena alexandri TaxID=1745969 RepID=A0AAD6WV82_9AGAR|nr:hypothetical protein C8F04DRAFT_1269964 [Mycena alexandri]
MAWVTIVSSPFVQFRSLHRSQYWVSALQLNPTYPSRDPSPPHKIQQHRVRTAQPNVDSPPQTHKITRTSQSAPTNASLASLDEAKIESSLIWIWIAFPRLSVF